MATVQIKSEQETKPVYQQMVGVDIAALTFTASRLILTKSEAPKAKPEAALSYQQTPAGFEKFEQLLLARGFAPPATLIVMEATSTYWHPKIRCHLSSANFRHFATLTTE